MEEVKEVKEVKMIQYFDDHWYKIVYINDEEKEITDYIPSVTTKLNIISKPFLARWRGDIGNREADMRMFEAQQRGTRIHNAWYTLTTEGVVLYQPIGRPNYQPGEIAALETEYSGNVAILQYQDEQMDVNKLHQWLGVVKPKIIASENTVYSLTNRDAGTVDNVMDIEEGEYLVNGSKKLELPAGRYIVDLKSGKQVDESAYMQVAAYSKCYEEMGLGEIVGSLILHTGAKTRSGIEGLATHYRNKEQLEQDYQDYRLTSALWERKNADKKPKVFEFPALLTIKKENEYDTGKES